MTKPKWLTIQQVDFIHEGALKMGGGLPGTRDTGLLESALARPQNLHAYGEKDTFTLAATYAEAILRNHPFADGNKRTAFYTAVDFLEQNGHELTPAKGQEHADMILDLEQERISRDDAAKYLREHSRSLTKTVGKKDWTKKADAKPRPVKSPTRDIDRDR